MTILFAWDLHGTLIKDAEYHTVEICNKVFPEFGIKKKVEIKDIGPLWGKPIGDVFMSLAPNLDKKKVSKIIKRFMEVEWKIGTHHIKPMDHAQFVLQTIKNTGNINLIITNTHKDVVQTFIEWVGLQDYIDHAIGLIPEETNGGFHSGEAKGLKVKRFAQQHRVSKIILIGDHADDIEAGKICGAYTIFFNPAGRPVPEGADETIGDLRKVLDVLEPTRI